MKILFKQGNVTLIDTFVTTRKKNQFFTLILFFPLYGHEFELEILFILKSGYLILRTYYTYYKFVIKTWAWSLVQQVRYLPGET